MSVMGQDKSVAERLWAVAIWALVIFFIVNVIATIAAVAVSSLGTRWFGGWLPAGFTTKWFGVAWHDPQVRDALWLSVRAALLERRWSRAACSAPAGLRAAHQTKAERAPGVDSHPLNALANSSRRGSSSNTSETRRRRSRI